MTLQTDTSIAVEEWIAEPYRDLPSGSDALVALRHTLDAEGVAELPGFLTPEAHALLREQILALESEATPSTQGGNHKYAIKSDRLTDTVVGQLARSDFMLGTVNALLGPRDGRPALVEPPIRSEEIIPGINLMRGPGDVTAFHFDGSYLNLIFPVIIPTIESQNRGQLVIYPNMRPFQKSFWGSKVIPALVRVPPLRRLWKRREVDYREDTVYAFYGYRSYHGVESPAEAALRCITNMTVGQPRF